MEVNLRRNSKNRVEEIKIFLISYLNTWGIAFKIVFFGLWFENPLAGFEIDLVSILLIRRE